MMGFHEKPPVYVLPMEGKFEGKHKIGLSTKNGNLTKHSYTVSNIEEAYKLQAFAEAIYKRGRDDHATELRSLIAEK